MKIMPRPFFYERGIACGTTCDKVLMAKMITVKELISHSYCIFLIKNGMQVKLPLKIPVKFGMEPLRPRKLNLKVFLESEL